MNYDKLKLDNQLCFPIYAASRLITREYQPFLDVLGLTYPQYLVLLVLWETDAITVNEISQRLLLNTNTLTPLLKRMEVQGLLTRSRSQADERKVVIELTEEGRKLKEKAVEIPQQLADGLLTSNMCISDLIDMKDKLYILINYLKTKNKDL